MSTISFAEWQERAARAAPHTQAYIDGAFVDALSGETFTDVSPRDGRTIAQVAACDQADVDRAVAAARRAYEDGRWSGLKPLRRKRVLLRFAELIRANREELALLETLDVGKPISDALKVDVSGAAASIQWYAEAIDKLYGEVGPTGPDALSLVTREPLGVVGAVVPWNYPMVIASWKLGPALATGNSLVLKPAEQSPLSALRLAELASEAGLPDGVLNVVPGFGETAGAALGRHPDVDKIAFTGSGEVGKLFLRYAGESNMKSVQLECGGKSPHIVCADADLQAAARAVAWGIFYNQGETCNAGSRLIVESSVRDSFIEMVMEIARDITVGDPLDPQTQLGALVDEGQMRRVLDYIALGRREGARLRLGGEQLQAESGGYYVAPTVFAEVSNDMRIAREEIFGPVLAVLDFVSPEQALELANDTEYGLAAGLWTNDVRRAHRMARGLRAGTVWVNTFDASDVTVPFGGFKQSGFGRDKSLHALEQYTQLKTTWLAL